jgi:hypothetical protein
MVCHLPRSFPPIKTISDASESCRSILAQYLVCNLANLRLLISVQLSSAWWFTLCKFNFNKCGAREQADSARGTIVPGFVLVFEMLGFASGNLTLGGRDYCVHHDQTDAHSSTNNIWI